jgi:hypothetical protein
MSREFWAVRHPAWVVGGLAIAVAVMTAWLLRAKSGVNTAAVLSLTAGSFSLAAQPTTVMRQNIAYAQAAGLAAGLTAWVRYLIGCWLARREGMLPRRVGRFLNWAYDANLLRMSGTAAQFRHRELQAWLISHTKDHPAQAGQKQENKVLYRAKVKRNPAIPAGPG